MKYTFFDNMKQRANGYPFEVTFESDDDSGTVIVYAHDVGFLPRFEYVGSEWFHVENKELLHEELDMHLTGEAYVD